MRTIKSLKSRTSIILSSPRSHPVAVTCVQLRTNVDYTFFNCFRRILSLLCVFSIPLVCLFFPPVRRHSDRPLYDSVYYYYTLNSEKKIYIYSKCITCFCTRFRKIIYNIQIFKYCIAVLLLFCIFCFDSRLGRNKNEIECFRYRHIYVARTNLGLSSVRW